MRSQSTAAISVIAGPIFVESHRRGGVGIRGGFQADGDSAGLNSAESA